MQVTCPACQKTLQSKDDLSGKTVKCKCGQAFAVPKATSAAPRVASTSAVAGATATATPKVATAAASTAAGSKIPVTCSCGKTLQAPAAAAGKAVKCPCGQVVRVPAPAATTAQRAPAAVAKPTAVAVANPAPTANRWPAAAAAPANASPNPFGDMSDDEWQSMVQAHAPKQVDHSKPKEKSAAAKMLDEARKETGQGNVLAMDAAKGFLNKTRGILVGLGCLCMVRAVVAYWLISSLIDSLMQAGGDSDEASIIKIIVMVFCGIDLGIGVLYIISGFLVSIFPLTCTISALVIFTLVEIANFIVDPGRILSIRGWIFRIAIFGGLIQGINNAAYYRHIKAEEKAAKKARGG